MSVFVGEVVAQRLDRPRLRRQVGEHPAVVRDCDLELIAVRENPVLILTA